MTRTQLVLAVALWAFAIAYIVMGVAAGYPVFLLAIPGAFLLLVPIRRWRRRRG